MAILTGRYGTVKWDATGLPSPAAPLTVISMNGWKLSLKTDYEDVTCFGDLNKVYIQGLRDISGTLAGFWNSAGYPLITATGSSVPGYLELAPNSNEASFKFGGLAYMDADLDCTVKGAPKLSGTYKAAGPWTTP
jgi:hypothetical protein